MENIIPLVSLLILLVVVVLIIALHLQKKANNISQLISESRKKCDESFFKKQLNNLSSEQINALMDLIKNKKGVITKSVVIFMLSFMGFSSTFAQNFDKGKPALSEGAVIVTIILLLIPVIVGLFIMAMRIRKVVHKYTSESNVAKAKQLAEYIENQPTDTFTEDLAKRQSAVEYNLQNNELSGDLPVQDTKGIINIKDDTALPFVAVKRKAAERSPIDPKLSKLVLWYLITATFWLLFGTTVGEYVGIKFVAPDADHLSWLSFGRLRPVHTNSVFWGWASLGMIGLGYYVVPRVGNSPLHSYKLAWYALVLINVTVLLGSISLMAGINNGGGEYREYIWPIMALFGVALIMTLYNYLKTIAKRKTTEIYISNWYIVSAVMFVLVIAFVAYWPSWQNGLGETIVQGYYMHQGVGMWFMLFTLGLVYYYLPQQLNKPIFSYSLGILAFWTQILFYTLIGSHHFVFSSIPWWLQTVAIFGSVGMAIPVIAGTTNFLMTFKNGWYKLNDSYTLPFFLVGTIFYLTGSLQGTVEAFRSTNLYWHFTDFTVAHSHLTMYGIISFYLWACIYTIVPRFTNTEAPQVTVGTHFWLALIGLLFYTVPLMYGSTVKGQMWIDGKPFIESVSYMMQHWLWRAIGGSLMWTSHIFFAYNLYKMMPSEKVVDVNDKAIEILKENLSTSKGKLD